MPLILPAHIPQCQHVRTTGVRCGSPALRGKKHCYYHSAFGQTTRVVRDFEDAESIQLALRQVINWVAQGMDTKRAALTLYALQIASTNLKQMSRHVSPYDVVCDLPEELEAALATAPAARKKPGIARPIGKQIRASHVKPHVTRSHPASISAPATSDKEVWSTEKQSTTANTDTASTDKNPGTSPSPQSGVILSEGGIPPAFSKAGNPSRRTSRLPCETETSNTENCLKKANGVANGGHQERMQNG